MVQSNYDREYIYIRLAICISGRVEKIIPRSVLVNIAYVYHYFAVEKVSFIKFPDLYLNHRKGLRKKGK